MEIIKCSKCNKSLRIGTEQVGIDEKNIPVYHRFGYCDNCMCKYDLDAMNNKDNNKKGKKKDSTLSILAAIFSIFTFTIIIGVILAIIDLCINDKEKKHTGSWFSLIFFGLFLLVSFASSSNNSKNENVPTNEIYQSDENNSYGTKETEQIKISDKEILFMDLPWGTSFTKVNELHGELGIWGISGEEFKTFSVDEVLLGDYKGIDFDYGDINIIGNCQNSEIEIAGYTTNEITLYFAYDIMDGVLKKTENESSLYGGQYIFNTENLDGMSKDLIEKLTALYGEPSKTTKEIDLWQNEYTYTWWYGQNDTVLVLKTLNSENDTSDLYDDEITISYAWLKGDELLQQASDLLKQEAKDKEELNYGNQNTNGL